MVGRWGLQSSTEREVELSVVLLALVFGLCVLAGAARIGGDLRRSAMQLYRGFSDYLRPNVRIGEEYCWEGIERISDNDNRSKM